MIIRTAAAIDARERLENLKEPILARALDKVPRESTLPPVEKRADAVATHDFTTDSDDALVFERLHLQSRLNHVEWDG